MYLELLGERVRVCIPEEDVKQIRMFGGLCFMVNGNMLCCAMKDGLLVRVGKDQEAKALAQPHATPMMPGGRPMAGFVRIDADGLTTDEELKAWVDMARHFVCSLPPGARKEKAG